MSGQSLAKFSKSSNPNGLIEKAASSIAGNLLTASFTRWHFPFDDILRFMACYSLSLQAQSLSFECSHCGQWAVAWWKPGGLVAKHGLPDQQPRIPQPW